MIKPVAEGPLPLLLNELHRFQFRAYEWRAAAGDMCFGVRLLDLHGKPRAALVRWNHGAPATRTAAIREACNFVAMVLLRPQAPCRLLFGETLARQVLQQWFCDELLPEVEQTMPEVLDAVNRGSDLYEMDVGRGVLTWRQTWIRPTASNAMAPDDLALVAPDAPAPERIELVKLSSEQREAIAEALRQFAPVLDGDAIDRALDAIMGPRVDGPMFRSGRREGHADVAALLRLATGLGQSPLPLVLEAASRYALFCKAPGAMLVLEGEAEHALEGLVSK